MEDYNGEMWMIELPFSRFFLFTDYVYAKLTEFVLVDLQNCYFELAEELREPIAQAVERVAETSQLIYDTFGDELPTDYTHEVGQHLANLLTLGEHFASILPLMQENISEDEWYNVDYLIRHGRKFVKKLSEI